MTNQKSLDKKKTKELDKAHEVLMSYIQTFADRPVLEIGVDFTNFDKLLTQQRTELLEEILDLVDKLHMPVGRRELEEEIKNLKQK